MVFGKYYKKRSRSGLAWSRPQVDRGPSRPASVFRTTIGVCKILSRSVEIWQYEGQKPVLSIKKQSTGKPMLRLGRQLSGTTACVMTLQYRKLN